MVNTIDEYEYIEGLKYDTKLPAIVIRVVPQSTRLQHRKWARSTGEYLTFTEYRREITVFVVEFRPMSESSGGLLPLYQPTTSRHQPLPSPSAHFFLHQISYCACIFLPKWLATHWRLLRSSECPWAAMTTTVLYIGPGVYTTVDGDTYSTEWVEEKLPVNVETTVVYSDGSKYHGYFKDWMYSGKGKYFYPDGSWMECDFFENCPIDNLTFTDPNGHAWLGKADVGFGWLEPSNHYYRYLNGENSAGKILRMTNTARKNQQSSDVEKY
ncbi:hypothetical protein EVAR_19163_1 [Eumeta japonica]|uniref:MORN repeat-containing protein 5 n=1 Tax=Eumeta variegata TaxID=151549 RepID=A0A4C1VQF7_EUMVA|nr:hypothetical protein EVAR_19163_1 [Eumeta japonica]